MATTLSHSQIETFTACERRWQFTKIERVPEAPSPHLALGTAVHSAIESDMRRRSNGVRQSPAQTHLMALAAFHTALADELATRDPAGLLASERATLVRRGEAILAAYAYHAAPRLYPVRGGVEESFKVAIPDLPGWQFTGRMDARTQVAGRAPVVIDFKTGKRWLPGSEHHKMQASAYLWADSLSRRQQHAESVAFICLPDTTDAENGRTVADVDIRVTRRTPGQIAGYVAHIRDVAGQIEQAKASGDFPARTGVLCGWCGVAYACEAGKAWLRQQGRQMQPAIA